MAIHISTRAEQRGSITVAVGDYLIQQQRSAIDLLWRVALVTGPYAYNHEVLATFSTKSLVFTFVLSHDSTSAIVGRSKQTALQSAVLALIQHPIAGVHTPPAAGRLVRLLQWQHTPTLSAQEVP